MFERRAPFPWLLAAVWLTACDNKCDELVGVLTDCVVGQVGAEEDEETADPAGDAECSSTDSACATCILESKLDLCVEYGVALEGCRASGDCE